MDIKLMKQNFKEKVFSGFYREYFDKELFTIKTLVPIAKAYGYENVRYKIGLNENGEIRGGEYLFVYVEHDDNIPCFSINVSADSERAMIDDFIRGLQHEDYRRYNNIAFYEETDNIYFSMPSALI